MDATLFWTNAKLLMKDLKKTQDDMAKVCDVSFGTFHGWISRNIFPDVASAYAMAKELGTTVDYLLTGEPPADSYEKKYRELVSKLRELIG